MTERIKSPGDEKREQIRLDPADRDKFYRDMDKEGLEVSQQPVPFRRNTSPKEPWRL